MSQISRRSRLKVCRQPGCPELSIPGTGTCELHSHLEQRPWRNARDRRTRNSTGSGWAEQRRAQRILKRYKRTCHVCGLGGATEIDHVEPLEFGGPDNESNLRPIHTDCHKVKTAAEAKRRVNV